MLRIRNISHTAHARTAADQTFRSGDSKWVRVYTGDVVTSSMPVTLDVLLGSCVAVCLFDLFFPSGA